MNKIPPSKEKRARDVPEMAATVRVVRLLGTTDDGTACLHSTVVSLDHAVVVQSASAMAAVGVGSMEAKLRPVSVAEAPPLVGALALVPTRSYETAGAAYGVATIKFQTQRFFQACST